MQVLEGLEPVRKRPGMYIGSTGPTGLHHCVWEVVDNSVDEAMAGYCDRIDVTLLADGGCRVVDNGRGIPTDIHPQSTRSRASRSRSPSCTAAASSAATATRSPAACTASACRSSTRCRRRLVVEVDRDGKRYRMDFANGGKPQGKLEVAGEAPRNGRTGTTVTFWPDRTVFETVEFSARTILERLQMMAFLNKGLEIRFQRRAPGPRHRAGRLQVRRRHRRLRQARQQDEGEPVLQGRLLRADRGRRPEVEVAFQWNTGYNTDGIHSFANGINTIEGGTHEEGFKAALTTAVNRYARAKSLLKEKDDNLLGEDIREGLTAIISRAAARPPVRGPDQGQAGQHVDEDARRSGPPTRSWATGSRRTPPRPTRSSSKAHRRPPRPGSRPSKARDVVRRKSLLDGAGMPDKLKDCSSQEPRASASCSSSRATRPAARPSRPATRDPGDPAHPGQDPQRRAGPHRQDAEEHRDPDADLGHRRRPRRRVRRRQAPLRQGHASWPTPTSTAAHIRTLLLTFFFRQMKPLVEQGHVYIAQPPLYSTEVGKEKIYLKDDAAKDRFLAEQPEPQEGVPAAQGPRRDGLRGARRHHDGPRRSARCCRSPSSRRRSPTRCCRSSWATTSRCASTSSRPTPTTSGSSTSDDATCLTTTPTRRPDGDGDDGVERGRLGDRAHRDPGGDGALLPRLRHVGHHRAGAARRPRRPEAGAPPDPVGHARHRRPPRPQPR